MFSLLDASASPVTQRADYEVEPINRYYLLLRQDLVNAIAGTVGGEVAAKLIARVKLNGSFGYTAVLPESGRRKIRQ
jgi:hypothetical protein